MKTKEKQLWIDGIRIAIVVGLIGLMIELIFWQI